MDTTTIKCQQCGRELKPSDRPCPICGCNRRHYEVQLKDNIGLSTSIGYALKDPTGFTKVKAMDRNKTSAGSGRKAKESLVIDRTDPHTTRKLHRVEELNEMGEYEVVHDENIEYPAKRRPSP